MIHFQCPNCGFKEDSTKSRIKNSSFPSCRECHTEYEITLVENITLQKDKDKDNPDLIKDYIKSFNKQFKR